MIIKELDGRLLNSDKITEFAKVESVVGKGWYICGYSGNSEWLVANLLTEAEADYLMRWIEACFGSGDYICNLPYALKNYRKENKEEAGGD